MSRTCNEKTIEHLKLSTAVNLEYSNEFIFDITVDNLKTGESKSSNMFGDHIITPTHLNSTRHSIQIATKMVSIWYFSLFMHFI